MEQSPIVAYAGANFRVTPDGKRFSVFDWLEAEGFGNPRATWERLHVQYPEDMQEVVRFCDNFHFPGPGQRPTPVITTEGAELLALLLPSKRGAKWRKTLLDTFRAVERGDIRVAAHIIEKQTDPKTLDWLTERTEAKKSNHARNKAIEEHGGTGKQIYIHCSNNLNRHITGFTAKKIKEAAGVMHTRDALSPLQLALIRAGELAQIEAMDRDQASGNVRIRRATDRSDAILGRTARDLKTHDPRLIWDRTNAKERALKRRVKAIGI